ncbi:MAG: hypothetical protein AAGD07_14795 [Planctomycetota bacterium]
MARQPAADTKKNATNAQVSLSCILWLMVERVRREERDFKGTTRELEQGLGAVSAVSHEFHSRGKDSAMTDETFIPSDTKSQAPLAKPIQPARRLAIGKVWVNLLTLTIGSRLRSAPKVADR